MHFFEGILKKKSKYAIIYKYGSRMCMRHA